MHRLIAAAFLLLLSCVGGTAVAQVAPHPTFTGTATFTSGLTVNGARPPAQADDITVPFADGNSWTSPSGQVFQTQDVTAGFAMWQQVQSSVLPGDVVGLNVSAASYTSAGGSCVANEVLTFTGGMQVTVTVCSGGVPSTYSVTQSRMHACMPATPTSISPLTTTGGDGSSVWSLTIQSPMAIYGTRLLTRCYNGNAINVVRSDTGETLNVGFQSNGALDTKTLDGFAGNSQPTAQYTTYAAGVNPRLATWYDQGALGNNATQSTAAERPTIFPGRQIGNSRSVMFDGGGGSPNLWDPTSYTFLNLPSGVSVAGNNMTVAVLGGAAGRHNNAYFLHIGAQNSTPLIYLFAGQLSASGGVGCQNQGNGTNSIFAPSAPDEGTLMLCVGNSSSTTFYEGQFSASGAAGVSTTLSGGTLGELWNNTVSQPSDEAMVIVVPWALTTTEQAAFQASVAATFGTAPQKRGVIVALGDSHVDDWGYPYQQTLLRQGMSLLGRPDISYVNTADTGGDISSFVNSSLWNDTIAPTLAAYTGNKYVYLEGGYNDINGGQTVSQVEASYTSLASSTHSAGAKTICDTDVIRNATLTQNQDIQQVAAWMQATPSVCDYVFNSQAYSVFDALSGPWSLPWFEQQDSGLHMTAAGNGLRAAMFAKFVQANGLFQ